MADFEEDARTDEADVSERIDRYADELRAAGAIRSPQVERAFRTVQRHRMLETFYHRDAEGRVTVHHDPGHPCRDHLELIYTDTALATRYIGGRPASSTSQASLVPLEHADGHPLVLVGRDDGALRGRVVLWTGFMPVRGPLQMSGEGEAGGLWSRGMVMADPADVVHEPGAGRSSAGSTASW